MKPLFYSSKFDHLLKAECSLFIIITFTWLHHLFVDFHFIFICSLLPFCPWRECQPLPNDGPDGRPVPLPADAGPRLSESQPGQWQLFPQIQEVMSQSNVFILGDIPLFSLAHRKRSSWSRKIASQFPAEYQSGLANCKARKLEVFWVWEAEF